MTVVIFDGRTIAADQACFNGDMKNQMTPEKLTKSFALARGPAIHLGLNKADGWEDHKYVLGQAGYFCDMEKMRRWLIEGDQRHTAPYTPDQLPKLGADAEDGIGLLLNITTGELYELYGGFVCMRVHSVPYAIGSASSMAFGAVMGGATAVQAVEIACQFAVYAGHGACSYTLSHELDTRGLYTHLPDRFKR